MGDQEPIFVGLLEYAVTITKFTLPIIKLNQFAGTNFDGLQGHEQVAELNALGANILNRCCTHITGD